MAYMTYFLFLIITNILNPTATSAFDPTPLQDICVADFTLAATPSGLYPCKDPSTVTVDDFFESGLDIPVDTNNPYHAAFVGVSVYSIPGLNAMGMSMARADLAPHGFFPLHYHRKATELNVVLEGCLEMGFITPESSNYTHYRKKLHKGDVFVVPVGLIHYQANCWGRRTSVYAILNSQYPGVDSITHAAFGASPKIDPDYLAHVYQLDEKVIKSLQGKDWQENI